MRLKEFVRRGTTHELSEITLAIAATSVKVWESIPFRARLLAQVNPSGDTQKAIDVYSNDLFLNSLIESHCALEVASEEMSAPVKGRGGVSVAMDPLDGSSNVGTNNALGSIFGFYSERLPCSGRFLSGALFVTYGSMLTLTMSFGRGVHRFVALRRGSRYDFELLNADIKIPQNPEVYGFGGPESEWIPPVREFVEALKRRGMRIRYCGTFVGDFNQVLARGGIFAYPALIKKPKGKLRVLFETAPMSYIAEQAGGYGTDGNGSLLEIEPKKLSETSPAYLGTSELTRALERAVSS